MGIHARPKQVWMTGTNASRQCLHHEMLHHLFSQRLSSSEKLVVLQSAQLKTRKGQTSGQRNRNSTSRPSIDVSQVACHGRPGLMAWRRFSIICSLLSSAAARWCLQVHHHSASILAGQPKETAVPQYRVRQRGRDDGGAPSSSKCDWAPSHSAIL